MTASPRVILAVMVMVAIIGSWALWRLSVWADDRARHADVEWRNAFEPNKDGDLTPHVPPDAMSERPLTPQEYRELGR